MDVFFFHINFVSSIKVERHYDIRLSNFYSGILYQRIYIYATRIFRSFFVPYQA